MMQQSFLNEAVPNIGLYVSSEACARQLEMLML